MIKKKSIEVDYCSCDLCSSEDNLFQIRGYSIAWDENIHLCGSCLESKFATWLESQKIANKEHSQKKNIKPTV